MSSSGDHARVLRKAERGTHQVHIVIFPGFKSMEAIGPINVFTYANRHLARLGDMRQYSLSVVAPYPGQIPSDTLISMQASEALPESAPLETVMVAGAVDIHAALTKETDLTDWCRRRAPDVERFAALCSGAFFLAEAGLLDGRRATTHWGVADLLRRQFPSVVVEADAIFIQDGNIWTSAGVTAAIDLALAYVEQDFGRNLALEVARDLVIYLKRPGGQSQFSRLLTSQMTGSVGMRDVQNWLHAHFEKPLKVSDMAAKANMSVRSFTRQFSRDLGTSPANYLEGIRCENAVSLLLDTDLPLKALAFQSGFGSDDVMRKVFLRRYCLTPLQYRERFKTASG
ncbi:AraC family transcriptional regulator [Aureimonas ureilytica]|uniref:AraC family transcriptional regulator n=1 Tax=Aureimonas ureilytica TaxID=401562 RepID=A0A175RC66_9HYPH|nr:helix-turn-helix domain-containing protein [Aureimonas ureilytica]KTQ97121.1 AraC family transcriptional regulator [Aureimonas ureilytica]